MNEVRFLNLLGLAQRAGKLLSGDFVVERTLRRRQVPLLLLAGDCAENNSKKYKQMAETRNIPLQIVLTKEKLGNAIGKNMRAVIIVDDTGFARKLLAEIDDQ